jgi:nicotinamide mononucleotide transporter
METLLNINNTFFTVLGYPMSYIEFFGTILNIWCVWLVVKNRILNWPVGILSTILFGVLFLQIRLYADFFEQIYFFITGFWGWWVWTRGRTDESESKPIEHVSSVGRIWWGTGIASGTMILGYLTAHLHVYFPMVFVEPASYPYLDAFTTVLSFVATILLIKKKFEAWYLWILVDIIGIGLYWVKDVHLISLLYVIFLFLAIQGLINWITIYKTQLNRHD